MDLDFIVAKKALEIFGVKYSSEDLANFCQQQNLPPLKKRKIGKTYYWGWPISDLPEIGAKYSFCSKPSTPKCLCFFTTKGGVLKTTLAYNMARLSALNGIKTCVVGLDIQGDITQSLNGYFEDSEENQDLPKLLKKIEETKGLYDFFQGNLPLSELILPTDLPTLHYIPETPELAALSDSLAHIHRREYWLKEKIVAKLKEKYDLIILDCSPNWNKLTTNALVSCDLLVSPLECKINNFRNFKMFRHFVQEFKKELMLNFNLLYIPTKIAKNKKLSSDIYDWYLKNLPECFAIGLKESLKTEESMALKISLVEYSPRALVALEMKSVIKEIFNRMADLNCKRPSSSSSPSPFSLTYQ